MIDALIVFYEAVSIIDLIFLIMTILSVIKCYNKGFILSLLSASKWLLAYVVTLILFPKIKPYFKNIIDSEYVLDVTLGLSIFILVIFIILVVNKGISKTVKFVGLGRLDSLFGLLFGFIRGYIICVCLFTCINYVYNHKNWELNINNSKTFSWVENGSNLLIKVFPSENDYKDAKEKIEDI